MEWILLSLSSSFLSAIVAIIRKRITQRSGLEFFIGMVNFLSVAVILGAIYLLFYDVSLVFSLSANFWLLVFLHVVLESIAFYFLLKATHHGEITYVVPILSGTNIFVFIASYFVLNEKPSLLSAFALLIIIVGIVIINFNNKKSNKVKRGNIKSFLLLTVTILCWSFTPIIRKMALQEMAPIFSKGSSLFFASVLSLFIGLSYLFFFLVFGRKKIKLLQKKEKSLLFYIIFGGSFIYSLSIWSHYAALTMTFASYATVIKDTTPIFVFILGFLFLKERGDTKDNFRKIIATIIIVSGSIALTLLK